MMNKEVMIEKLKFPDNIRKRMGMFGADGENADILFREIVDNAVDLVLKTRANLNIKSFTNIDGFNIIIDDGQGLPIYNDPDYHDDNDFSKQQPITIDLLSRINVGSNFHKIEYSSGLNGVGTKLTNALSDYFIVFVNASKKDIKTLTTEHKIKVKSGNTVYRLEFRKGELYSSSMIKFDDIINSLDFDKVSNKISSYINNDFGTIIIFKADNTLLNSIDVKYHGYPFRIIKGLFPLDKDFSNINVNFSIDGKEIEPLSFKDIFSKEVFIEDKIFTQSVSIKTLEPLPIKFIYQIAWNKDQFNSESDGSVNLLKTSTGRHIQLVQSAITSAFNKYNNIITSADSRLGMRLFVLSLAVEPNWNSQDKSKLANYQDKGVSEPEIIRILAESFLKVMKANTEFFDLICFRIIEYKKLQNNLSNIDLLKSSFILGDESEKRRAKSGDSARVYEATSREWDKRELYITEGLSASQPIIELRNKLFQSCLPLKGKLINTVGFNEIDLSKNREILAIINTIGCGIGNITDISKSKYGKIISATDADSDGSHISNLITTLFYSHVPELIKAGMLYKLETPYYRVTTDNKIEYFYSDEKNKIDFEKSSVRKLKGLGSWSTKDPKPVTDYIINPSTRRLVKISLDDLDEFYTKDAARLLSSSVARKQLMIDIGVLNDG